MKPSTEPLPQETLTEKKFHRRTILSFSLFALAPFAGWKIWDWIREQPKVAGTPKPLRAALNTDEKIFSEVFNPARLVKEYPASAAVKNVRVNGMEGLRDTLGMTDWRLQVARSSGDILELA